VTEPPELRWFRGTYHCLKERWPLCVGLTQLR
jgi:hypothetical protein